MSSLAAKNIPGFIPTLKRKFDQNLRGENFSYHFGFDDQQEKELEVESNHQQSNSARFETKKVTKR